MKQTLFLLLVTVLAVSCQTSSKLPTQHRVQEKYLLKELTDKGLYFGMSLEDFKKAAPKAIREAEDVMEFRQVFVENDLSPRVAEVTYYLENENNPEKPLYEFICVLKDGYDNQQIGREMFGEPNHKGEEWRFPPSQTGLPYTVAAWTFQNKIIFAATIKGTEWENGVD